MIVVSNPKELEGSLNASCVTIGNFDGVHKGHQKLISRVIQRGAKLSMLSVVVTFDPHPLRVITGKKTPPFITMTDQKLELISAMGVETCVVLPFDREMAAMPPEAFVNRYLVQGLAMKELVIGYDYAFGKGRRGDHALLRALGQEYGYTVERLDPVIIDEAIVSSTRIRDMVQAGNVWDVPSLLGRFYQIRGRVIEGYGRGASLLGFPTANLELEDELFPKPGVYAVWVQCQELSERPLMAVANIGYNPTFGNERLSVEAHILDFKKDIYDRELKIHFVQRIRAEKRFSGPEELVARIREDVSLGREILSAPEALI
jgi:riboflavin kinase/FMN adenylyltransferase